MMKKQRDHTIGARGDRGRSAGEAKKPSGSSSSVRETRWALSRRPACYLYGGEDVAVTPRGRRMVHLVATTTIVSWPLRWAGLGWLDMRSARALEFDRRAFFISAMRMAYRQADLRPSV